MPAKPLPKRHEVAERRRDERLHHLRETHALLGEVRAEHGRAFLAALDACSLAEVANVLGLSRSGVAHYRNQLKAGRIPRRAPETQTREA